MTLRFMHAGLLLVLAACGTSSGTTAQPSGDAARPFVASPVTSFDSPWAMAFLPRSTLAIVTEKPGRVWLVDVATGAKQQVAGVPKVHFEGQAGLLDVVISPTFKKDNLVYLTYSEPTANGGSSLALARSKLARDGAARFDGLQVIWRDPERGRGGQFGAIVVFSPDGRYLYLSVGERQRFTPAQDPNSPLGKILRLTLDGKPAPGNPWADRTGAPTVLVSDPPRDTEAAKRTAGRRTAWPGPNLTPAETWSTGHRNPYGLTFAPDGRLWATEMGPKGGDEVNLILPGRNYGWPIVSNGDNYDGVPISRHSTRPDFEAPKLWWNPSISPTSLLIYTGNLFPQWKGSGLIGALSGKSLIRITIDGDTARKADQWDMGARIRFAGQGPDGAVYLLEDGPGARLLRLDPVRR
jgi:aldose sugar dehydrogenase